MIGAATFATSVTIDGMRAATNTGGKKGKRGIEKRGKGQKGTLINPTRLLPVHLFPYRFSGCRRF